jgi:hypothetical protein
MTPIEGLNSTMTISAIKAKIRHSTSLELNATGGKVQLATTAI